jgi:hypothetical protein
MVHGGSRLRQYCSMGKPPNSLMFLHLQKFARNPFQNGNSHSPHIKLLTPPVARLETSPEAGDSSSAVGVYQVKEREQEFKNPSNAAGEMVGVFALCSNYNQHGPLFGLRYIFDRCCTIPE